MRITQFHILFLSILLPSIILIVVVLYSDTSASKKQEYKKSCCKKWKYREFIGSVKNNNISVNPRGYRIDFTNNNQVILSANYFKGKHFTNDHIIHHITIGDSLHKKGGNSILYLYKVDGSIITLERKCCPTESSFSIE